MFCGDTGPGRPDGSSFWSHNRSGDPSFQRSGSPFRAGLGSGEIAESTRSAFERGLECGRTKQPERLPSIRRGLRSAERDDTPPGCGSLRGRFPGVSLSSTPGEWMPTLRVGRPCPKATNVSSCGRQPGPRTVGRSNCEAVEPCGVRPLRGHGLCGGWSPGCTRSYSRSRPPALEMRPRLKPLQQLSGTEAVKEIFRVNRLAIRLPKPSRFRLLARCPPGSFPETPCPHLDPTLWETCLARFRAEEQCCVRSKEWILDGSPRRTG
jgi:hypothetical protein